MHPNSDVTYASNSETLAVYLGAQWGSGGRTTYAGLTLTPQGPRVYAEHTDTTYEYQPAIAVRRPMGVPVIIAADYEADTVDISIAETSARFGLVRGASTGLPTVLLQLGVTQHGPAPQATFEYDDAQVTAD
jgi:hypothetical protein